MYDDVLYLIMCCAVLCCDAGAHASNDDFWERQLRVRNEQLASLQQQLEAANRTAQETARAHDAQVCDVRAVGAMQY